MSSSSLDGRAPRRWGVRRSLLIALAVVLAVGVQWAVVVGSPPKVDPSGVDGLTIPRASVAPEDFVDEITNEWLPLRSGARWVRSGEVDGRRVVETTTVLAERREVGGIAATQVRTETVVDGVDGVAEAPVVRLYAQDRAGHVWLVGRAGEWTIDDEGAAAGLAMPSAPRRGDGWAREVRDGEPSERVRVGERPPATTTPAGRFEDLLGVVEMVPGPDGSPQESEVRLAAGVGEVFRTWGAGNQLVLETHLLGD
ncbi:hypothetical protein [Nocardioides gilvus]|uniref:hypothetical protein n=1 Tax=Nocardioides gilvus TaxID=1735589 RepID=UPI0013A5AA8A|nr:hypothetical protein [Nocardioides gilvus]